jgi:hypothetical protein
VISARPGRLKNALARSAKQCFYDKSEGVIFMDIEKVVAFFSQYLSEYLSILFLTLQNPKLT